MDYIYERIEYYINCEFKLFLQSVENVEKHWHNDFEILYILEGAVEIDINSEKTTLSEGNIYLINPNVLHSVKALKKNSSIVLQMPKEIFYAMSKNIIHIDFKYLTYDQMLTNEYSEVSKLMAEMAMIFLNKNRNDILLLKSLFYRFVFILSKHINSEYEVNTPLEDKNFIRLLEMLKVAKDYYKEDLSLSDFAEMFELTPQYFANFFKKNFGKPFMRYLNDLRIENAKILLIETEKPITEIANECGFTNIKSFNTFFKQIEGYTPSELRKSKINLTNDELKGITSYFDIEPTSYYRKLEKIVGNKETFNQNAFEVMRRIHVDSSKTSKSIKHNWKNLISVGRASHILNADIQKILIETQKEIGFKYIRFHGIFDDDMMVVDVDRNNNIVCNFTQIEKMVDFLLEINLKPFFELGFMPSKLAKEDDKIFLNNSSLSLPKDIQQWNKLIYEFITFLINKYGNDEVETWYFEFWNEPDVIDIFGFKCFEDYLEFYKVTYDQIKEVNANLKVGGPSYFTFDINDKKFEDYFNYCRLNSCMPDCLTIHFYPMNYDTSELHEFDNLQFFDEKELMNGIRISPDINLFEKSLNNINQYLIENNIKNLPVFVTEWNSTVWHRDLCSDTTYKSAYIVKNICNTMDLVDGIGYWMLSDFSHERFPANELYHGGLGLFTHNGLKKAGYFAYDFLNRLGNEFIEKGKMHYVTRSKKSIQILIFNYCQYNRPYREFDISRINNTDRTKVFEGENVTVQLLVDNLEKGKYKIKISRISSEYGSSYDEWLKIGSPEVLQKEEIEYLKSRTKPNFVLNTEFIEDSYEGFISLEKNEVVLVEMVKF